MLLIVLRFKKWKISTHDSARVREEALRCLFMDGYLHDQLTEALFTGASLSAEAVDLIVSFQFDE